MPRKNESKGELAILNFVAWFILALALLQAGCHSGGAPVTSTPTQSVVSSPLDGPTISQPATNPYYSNGNSVTLTGLCVENSRVALMGAASESTSCVNSTYSFDLKSSVDGVYTYSVTQIENSTTASRPSPFTWIRKSSVTPPILVNPTTANYSSAQTLLVLSGYCESGSTISVSGDATGSTTCTSSGFTLPISKFIDGTYNFEIEQRDPAGNSAKIPLVWKRAFLNITPSNPLLVVGTQQLISISGGTGNYTVTLSTNNSGATYNATTRVYTAGTLAGVNDVLTVTDDREASAQITITTVPGTADHLVRPNTGSGDNQSGKVSTALAQPLKVQVVDRYGNKVPQFPLFFQVLVGDSEITSPSAVFTNSDGFASINLMLGRQHLFHSIKIAPLGAPLPDLAVSGAATLFYSAQAVYTGTGQVGAAFKVGQNPSAAVSGDFNGDGLMDVAVLNTGDPSVGILLGKSSGLFASMLEIRPVCLGPNGFATKDLNGDGRLDLVLACTGSDFLAILLGRGDGTFETPVNMPTGGNQNLPVNVVITDINGDGIPDLANVAAGSNMLGVWYGTGSGSFTGPAEYALGQTPVALVAGDFDKNGANDLVVVNAGDNNFYLLLNDGTGLLTPQGGPYDTGQGPVAILSGDWNGDTYPDIAIANNSDSTVSILVNDTLLGWNDPVIIATGTSPTSLSATDINKDGFQDIIVSSGGDSSLTLLFGLGNGSFVPQAPVPTTPNPVFVISADVNSDSYSDLIVIGGSNQELQMIPGQPGGVLGFFAALGAEPSVAASGDFNEDGKMDLLVGSTIQGKVTLFLGKGNGLFNTSTEITTGITTSDIVVTDIDRDGHLDMIVSVSNLNSIKVYRGKGNGSFELSLDVNTGIAPKQIKVFDSNRDGKEDLAVVNENSNSVSVLLGIGDGTFQAKTDFPVGSAPRFLAVADMNLDGYIDLAVVNQSSSSLSVLIANGDGTFQSHAEYAVGNNPTAMLAIDVNQNGVPDIVTANDSDSSISVLLGQSDGSVAPKLDYFAYSNPTGIISGDFNGDAKVDLLTTNGNNLSMTLLTGLGNGQYNIATQIPTFSGSTNVIAADVNGDGAPDIIQLDGINQGLQVWVGH